MRTLIKNKRKFYYANFIESIPIIDEWGNETSEVKSVYDDPKLSYGNISASVGEEAIQVFGSLTNYSRTIALTNNPLKEGCRIWFGIEPTLPHNYVVTKVADSLNGYLVAIREA